MPPLTVVPRTRTCLLLALLVSLAGCNLQLSTDVEAKDTWTREYPLTADGTLSVTNSNGEIEVTGGDVDHITVKAERIVKASTEEAANQQLALLDMKEEVAADRVSIDSSVQGLTINVSRRVNYTITVPRGASVILQGSNSAITVSDLDGAVTAKASNGRIIARGLKQRVDASTSNGAIALEVSALTDNVTAETTNGAITLTLPRDADADFSARVANGAIRHDGLDLQVIEESRRRLDGRLGNGGHPVRLETTNGAITVKSQ